MHRRDKRHMKKLAKANPYYSTAITKKRISNGKKMAEYERLAKEQGVPVSRIIAQALEETDQ